MNGNDRLKDELRKRNNERLRESMFQGDGLKKTGNEKSLFNNQTESQDMTLNDISFDNAKLDLNLDNQKANINIKSDTNNSIKPEASSIENLSMDDVSDKTGEASNDTKKTAQDTSKSERLQNNDEETLNSGEDSVTGEEPEKKDDDSEKKDDDSEKKDDQEKKDDDSEKKDDPEKKDDTEEKDKSGESGDLENNADASKKEEEANKAAQKEQQEKEQQEAKEKEKQEKKDKKEEEKQKEEKKDKDSKGNDSKEKDKNDQKEKNAPPANNSKAGDKQQQKSGDKSRQKPGDRIRNSAQNKKNELTNKLKNPKKTLKDGIKNKATKSFNNSGVGKAVQKGKQTVENVKKAVKAVKNAAKAIQFLISTIHIWGPVVGVLILILIIAAVIVMLLPGNGGDVNSNNSDYSKTDQKTLEKIEKIFNKYPNADGTLGMAIVVYPYFANLHDGNVESYLTGSSDSSSEDDSEEEEDLEEEENDDNEDVENDKNEVEDDMYLIPFRNSKVRKRLKKVLKNIENASEDDVKQYLIDDYFKKDKGFTIGYDKDILTGYNGYKKLFKALDDDDKRERLEELIIKDLYDIKDMFVNYVYKNATCSASLVDAGNVSVDDMLKGTIFIDVKVDSCKTSEISGCDSWYSSPISLGEYVKGVVWTEMSVYEGINKEKVKAQMVAAKSYVLGRYKTMGWDLKQTEDGAYVVPIRSNTNDQDYCDYNEGCINKSSGNKHGAANEAQKTILNEAWEATKNLYIYDNSKNETTGAYCASRNKTSSYDCSWCTKGSCLSQSEVEELQDNDVYTVETILSEQYSNLAMVTIDGDIASAKTVGALVCTNKSSNMTAKRNQIAANAISYASKIPYYEGGLANSKIFEENNFGTDVTPDVDGRTKKGLNGVGFVNFIYWGILDNNFGNTNNFDNILAESYEITYDELLRADIGYSDDKSIIGVYVGDGKWAVMDPLAGNLVIKPDDRITNYVRNNYFKNEMYNYTIRATKPTPSEWNTTNIPYFAWPSANYLIGECVFYVKNRGLEIIEELYRNGSLNEGQYESYSKRLKNLSGNADQYWYRNINGNVGTVWNQFSNNAKSDSIEDIKAGSIMGVLSNSTQGAVYGHVFIIEYANSDENKIIISDSYNGTRTDCTKTDFKCITFKTYELTYEQFYSDYNSRFRGYLYFLNDN